MSFAKVFLSFIIILISVMVGYFTGQNTKTVYALPETPTVENLKKCNLLAGLKSQKIKEIKVWNYSDDKKFYGVISQVNEPPSDDSTFKTSDKLTIFDESGKTVYEYRDFEIENFNSARFLKSLSSEIMFEINGGGTDDFLKILSYKDGKFVEVIDSAETQYRGGYFPMIQYRSGMEFPYGKPSQLIIIRQIGGGDSNPNAAVFRTKDDKFQEVGEIEMQKLGDFIEQQLSKNISPKQTKKTEKSSF